MPGLRTLVEGFRTEDGTPVLPTLLIARRHAPPGIGLEALTAFRNALALAVILRNRVESITSGNHHGVRWADTFDFYPARVGTDGRLHFVSAAVRTIGGHRGALFATTAPYLHVTQEPLLTDWYIHKALGRAWVEQYARRRAARAWYGTALFRSLQLAYAAVAVPIRNAGSLVDYGTQIGLWVSAMEVLVRTDDETVKASQGRVGELLDAIPWYADQMRWVRRRRYVLTSTRHRKGGVRTIERRYVTPARRVLAVLYDARNDFLHGNPIRWTTLLPWGREQGEQGATLPNAAALLYRIALRSFLTQRYPVTAPDAEDDASILELLDDLASARALSAILRGPDAGDPDPDPESDS